MPINKIASGATHIPTCVTCWFKVRLRKTTGEVFYADSAIEKIRRAYLTEETTQSKHVNDVQNTEWSGRGQTEHCYPLSHTF